MKNPIGIELKCLGNLIMRYMCVAHDNKTIDKITKTNGWIIGFLAKNKEVDIFQKDIEEQFSITRSTASKVINLMVKKGFIKLQTVKEDKRLKKLIITEKAENILPIMDVYGNDLENTLLKGFTDEEIESLSSYIQRMKNNMRL